MFGQYAPECASTFFLYGKSLLANAVQKNSVLGEKADDQVKSATEMDDALTTQGNLVWFSQI